MVWTKFRLRRRILKKTLVFIWVALSTFMRPPQTAIRRGYLPLLSQADVADKREEHHARRRADAHRRCRRLSRAHGGPENILIEILRRIAIGTVDRKVTHVCERN